MSEASDAREILRALLDIPSSLGKKELTQLKAEGWRLLADESDDLHAIKQVIAQLFQGRKKRHGRPLGSLARHRHETDLQVFERIANGATIEAAIRGVYGDIGFEGHEKRIKRRRQTIKMLTKLADLKDD